MYKKDGHKKASPVYGTITLLVAICLITGGSFEKANGDNLSDSGNFGKWIRDKYGLVAYQYEMDPVRDERAVWMKGNKQSILHWHQLGNFRMNAIATNLGYIQLFYNESAQYWINYYYPENLAFAGGFGIVIEENQVFTSYRPFKPENAVIKMKFGSGYFEKEMVFGQIRLSEISFIPAGDLPVLIMRVTIKNESLEEKEITYIPYFDIAPFSLSPPFLTAFLSEKLGIWLSQMKTINLQFFPSDSLIVAQSKKYWGKYGGYPGSRRIRDPEFPDIFLKALGHQANGSICRPNKIFTNNGLQESLAFINPSWPESERLKGKPGALCLSLMSELKVPAGEEKTLYFAYGYAKALHSRDIIRRIGDPESRFRQTVRFWQENRPALEFDCSPFLGRELEWADYYLTSSFLYDAYYQESFAPQAGNYLYFAGVHGAMRDFAAYIMALSYYRPELARKMLALCMKNQDISGNLFYDFEGYGSRSIGGFLPFSGLLDYEPSDLSLWFIWAVCEYVYATRHFDF